MWNFKTMAPIIHRDQNKIQLFTIQNNFIWSMLNVVMFLWFKTHSNYIVKIFIRSINNLNINFWSVIYILHLIMSSGALWQWAVSILKPQKESPINLPLVTLRLLCFPCSVLSFTPLPIYHSVHTNNHMLYASCKCFGLAVMGQRVIK
jgi:hypothetical protein